MIITDTVVKIVAVAILLAHVLVLLFLRGRIGWVVALNLIVSAGAIAYWAANISDLLGSIAPVWAFVAFEALMLVTSVAAVLGTAVPRLVIWTGFAAHAALTIGALIFMATFKITRLM